LIIALPPQKTIMPNIRIGDRNWSYLKWTAPSHRSNELGNPVCRRIYLLASDNKRSPDLLNFGIMKDIPKDFCCTKSCLEFSSDHSPVILTVYSKIMIKNKSCTLCDVKGEWPYFQELFKPAELAESYRPISLLAVLSKLFEKLLFSRINIIMENHRLIPGHQFGFRSKCNNRADSRNCKRNEPRHESKQILLCDFPRCFAGFRQDLAPRTTL